MDSNSIMSIQVEYQNLSETERAEIDHYIDESLVEHLYKTTPSGIITALIVSTMIAIFLYKNAPFSPLLSWFVGFNSTQLFILALYISYKNFKNKFDTKSWGTAISVLISILSAFYGACVLFMPQEITRQFLLLAILLMSASSFSMASVGLFKLCIASVCFILVPVTIWAFSYGSFYYKISGVLLILYNFFLLAMNYRSTEWLKNSLKLTRMLTTVSHSANHDIFTDLPNQRGLLTLMDNMIKSPETSKQPFGVLCFSVNKLDMFHNSFGYPAGDVIIHSLAKRLTALTEEETDLHTHTPKPTYHITLPRPDSFAILVSPFKLEDLQEISERLFSVLGKPFYIQNRESRLTASLGVALYPNDGEEGMTLISNSYAAMFQAKQRGGNQIEVYKKSINEKTPYLLQLETDLHDALERKEFVLYYQPLIDLQNNSRVTGMEALIRWNHPKRGMIPPLDFIPLAEENGMIISIGEWVLEEAANQMIHWNNHGFGHLSLKVSVNLSPKQLRQPNIVETIRKVMEKTKLNPEQIELELTETAILDELVAPTIKAISEMGISLSIDDFGTGYSGLSYLKSFTIDKIKIDKSFIDDVTSKSESATIVSAILAMAKELGIKTLAEGVETIEQLNFLHERECQYIQGYYFSRPLSVEDLEVFLTKLPSSGIYTPPSS